MRDFRDLKVWERAHKLTLGVYAASKGFPRDELDGLTSQIRPSAASVPANIAEGCGRNGSAELSRFMQIALGSASELEYQILLAHDLGYLTDGDFEHLAANTIEVKRMLGSFIQRLRTENIQAAAVS
ncbi:MAG: four helix bundle protein [Chloroflexi bacterium]|nr:four helix bundle protein [Chloroflexota bacterium]